MIRLLVVVIVVALVSQAMAHVWYPRACCGEQDCHPVPCDELVEDRDGWLYIATGNRFVREQVLPSQDRHCHVCLGLADKRSLCAFIHMGI
jgi:hypothetical protein